jgi:uncharacterized membrane protein
MNLTIEDIAALKNASVPRKTNVKRVRLSTCEHRVLQALIALGAEKTPQAVTQKRIAIFAVGMLQPSISLRLAALQEKGYITIQKPGRTNVILVLKTPTKH